MTSNLLFDDKIFVFGRDFHQILPVIQQGTQAQIVNATFK